MTDLVPPQKQYFNRAFLVVMAAAVLVAAVGMIYYSLLLPLVLSAVFAYLLEPFVSYLERRRVKRSLAVSVIVIFFLMMVGFAVSRIVPVLYRQATLLVHLIPNAVQTLVDSWIPVVDRFLVDLGFETEVGLKEYWSGFNLFANIGEQLQGGIAGLWATGTSVLGGVINVVLVPLLTFFLLNEQPRLALGLRKLIPLDLIPPYEALLERIDRSLRSVIVGQLMVAGILAVLYVIGLSTVGLQSAVAIGVVAGACRVVPYLDVVVGGGLSALVILSNFQGWGQVLAVAVVFLTVQTLDGMLVTPRVIGERIGLHPIMVILSVLAFVDWFGFWGVIMVLPILAVVKVVIETLLPYYWNSQTYAPTWYKAGHLAAEQSRKGLRDLEDEA